MTETAAVIPKAVGGSVATAPVDLKVGTEAEARYMNSGNWYPCKIMAVYPAGTRKLLSSETLYDLRYEDGDAEEGVRRLKIRLKGEKQRRVLSKGEEVDAVCEACEEGVYGGVVLGEVGEGVYRVEFDLEAAGVSKQYGRVRVEEEVHRQYIFGLHRSVSGPTALASIQEDWQSVGPVVAHTIHAVSSRAGAGAGAAMCEGFLTGTLSREEGEDGRVRMVQRYSADKLFLGGLRKEFNNEDTLGKCSLFTIECYA